MTLKLQIARIEWTSGGEVTTTLDIAPNGEVIEYIPRAPNPAIQKTAGPVSAEWPVAHDDRNVTESIEISLARESNVWTAFHNIEAALERALYWGEGLRRDMRTVIRFQDTARHSDWFEAPLLGGRVELGKGPVCNLIIERGPYWDGPEAIVHVQNQWSSGWQDYADIYNCDDDVHNNWVYVYDPGGNAPAPARIRINNTYADNRVAEIRIGWSDRPQALTLEGEDSELSKVITPGVDYSNMATASAKSFRWDIPESAVRDYVGQFRVLAIGNLAAGTWRASAGWEISRKQYGTRAPVQGVGGITDLGVISLPPGSYSHPIRYQISVWLDGSAEGALDYVAFIPIRQYRRIRFNGYNSLPGTCVEDDGWRGETVYDYGGQRISELDVYGQPIALWPDGMLPGTAGNRLQMLSFVLVNDFGVAEALRSARVQVFARPRWRTLP